VQTKPWKPLPSVSAPEGTAWYETMLLLRPDASNAERAAELDKINAFLTKQGAGHVETTARDPAKTSYAIKGHSTVYYVQLMYTAEPKVVQALHGVWHRSLRPPTLTLSLQPCSLSRLWAPCPCCCAT